MAMFNYESDEIAKICQGSHSSDTLYVAECKHAIIQGVKGSYPQLCEYEKEWLEYGKVHYEGGSPSNLEYQSVTVNPSGTVENAIPFHYKSAILSGQTLVNIAPNMTQSSLTTNTRPWKLSGSGKVEGSVYDNKLKISTTIDGSMIVSGEVPNTMKPSTKYYVQVEVKNNSDHNLYFYKVSTQSINLTTGLNKFIITTVGDFNVNYMGITMGNSGSVKSGTEFEISNLMIIEYQDGMENWDIPYFEGMQSVKMPVLKVTGKNLFNICDFVNKLNEIAPKVTVIDDSTVQIISGSHYREVIFRPITFKENTSYTFQFYGESEEGRDRIANYFYIHYTDGTKKILNSLGLNVFTTPDSVTIDYIKMSYGVGGVTDTFKNFSIIEGISKEYEPHKSNILTVNEEVELRGIGEVRDELDLITGVSTRRVGYANINTFVAPPSYRTLDGGGYMALIELENKKSTTNLMSNLGIPIRGINFGDFGMYNNPGNIVIFKKGCTLEEITSIINQIEIMYELATESIKTVALSHLIKPYEGTNHYQTSSEVLPPIAELIVPVVSTGNQTLNDILTSE